MKKAVLALMASIFFTAGCLGSDLTTVYPTRATTYAMESRTVLVNVTCIDGSGWGSGVILTGSEILTAAHVVDNDSCLYTVKDNNDNTMPTTVVYADKAADLALIRVNHDFGIDTTIDFPYLGEKVWAVGYPAQLLDWDTPYLSITSGEVATLDIDAGDKHYNRITTPTFFGNSGGPVFDNNAHVVGIILALNKQAEGYFYSAPVENIIKFLKVAHTK